MAKATSPTTTDSKDPPQKHVLLLTCMDSRLTDNTTHFMDGFNLTNRYDHLSFAGAAMGVGKLKTPCGSGACAWSDVFFQHLDVAIETLGRDIKDIIILEHLDCGAYKYLHPDDAPNGTREKYFKFSEAGQTMKQKPIHEREAREFAEEIEKHFKNRYKERTKELKHLTQVVLSGSGDEEQLNRIADLKKFIKAWSHVNVRCYVMDLEGQVHVM